GRVLPAATNRPPLSPNQSMQKLPCISDRRRGRHTPRPTRLGVGYTPFLSCRTSSHQPPPPCAGPLQIFRVSIEKPVLPLGNQPILFRRRQSLFVRKQPFEAPSNVTQRHPAQVTLPSSIIDWRRVA